MRPAIELPPAGDVEGDIPGGEIVAIRPFHPRTDLEHIFRGVRIDLPALQQNRLEGEVRLPAHQRLEKLHGDVAHLRNLETARVLELHHLHGDTHDAPLPGLDRVLGPRWDRLADEPVGNRRAGTEGAGQRQELAATKRAAFCTPRKCADRGMKRFGCHIGSPIVDFTSKFGGMPLPHRREALSSVGSRKRRSRGDGEGEPG
jgi:hypothetical protein